ncbi:MAG: AraC family transcriptional regulator [Cyanobacteria bacterium P01_D01_bin.44]
MGDLSDQGIKLWRISEFDNLELLRAESIYHSYARHAHPGYSIGIIESGVGGSYYRGNTYLAPPRSVVFMNPEEPHTGYSAEGLPLTYRMLYPSFGLIQQIATEADIKGSPYFKEFFIEDDALARQIFSLHIVLEQSPDRLEKQSSLVEVISTLLLNYADFDTRSRQSNQEHRAVQLIKAYLHENFSVNVSLEHLVDLTGLNRSYLIRVFRQTVGMPPYEYLTQIRVRKAKQLLETGLPIAEVAIAVGMSDQSHLTRHFKSLVGMTPGHYRKMSTSFKTDDS